MAGWFTSLRERLRAQFRVPAFIHTLAPADVWPDAVRMVVAAVGAFEACQLLHLHGGFFAVLTALLTARPAGAGGASAVIDRLLGMGAGILAGIALMWLKRYHVPTVALVAAAMVPLCYIVARFRKYQSAPIAAILVLSAGDAVGSALHAALWRALEVVLGAAIGFAVSALVFRRTTDRRSRQHAADMLRGCGLLMSAATAGAPLARDTALRSRIRTDMRLVMTTSGFLPGRGRKLAKTHIAALLKLQADLMFLGRALQGVKLAWRARARPLLQRIADCFQTLCDETATVITDGGQTPDFSAFDAALARLEAPSERGTPRGDEANAALPFLLRLLRTDLLEVLGHYDATPAPGGDIDIEPFDDSPMLLASG